MERVVVVVVSCGGGGVASERKRTFNIAPSLTYKRRDHHRSIRSDGSCCIRGSNILDPKGENSQTYLALSSSAKNPIAINSVESAGDGSDAPQGGGFDVGGLETDPRW
ncbi:hypothetical protein HKD37_04G011544 [Glycine soja]